MSDHDSPDEVDPTRSASEDSAPESLSLTAIPTHRDVDVAIRPAGRKRPWLEGGFGRHARQCLPLMIANEAGWFLVNPAPVTIMWNGDVRVGHGLEIDYDGVRSRYQLVADSFGNGIVSFRVPYIFRTSPGWNLLVRGPSNHYKDGISPLEGLIETDWLSSPFTMNWKITRPETPITFDAGEPFCMVVPQRREDLENVRPRLESAATHPEVKTHAEQFGEERRRQLISEFLRQSGVADPDLVEPAGLNYLQGRNPDGTRPTEHRTRLILRPFEDRR